MVRVNPFVSLLVLFAWLVTSLPTPDEGALEPRSTWPLITELQIASNARTRITINEDNTIAGLWSNPPYTAWVSFPMELVYHIKTPHFKTYGFKFNDHNDFRWQLTFVDGLARVLLYHIGGPLPHDQTWSCGGHCFASQF